MPHYRLAVSSCVSLSIFLSRKSQLSLVPTDKLITTPQPCMTNVTHLRPGPEIRATFHLPPPSASLDQVRQQCAAKCLQVQEGKSLCVRQIEREREGGWREGGGRERFLEPRGQLNLNLTPSCLPLCYQWPVVTHKDKSFFSHSASL